MILKIFKNKKMNNKKKLLFIVNVDWFFISHRLPIALSAIDKGSFLVLSCIGETHTNGLPFTSLAI